MAAFPVLKSGAVAQAPFTRGVRYGTDVVRFCGGGEQRFPLRGGGVRRWQVALSRLDEGEMRTVANFYEQHGPYGISFEFRDPVSGELFEECVFADGGLELSAAGVHSGESVVRIEQRVSAV